MRNGLPSSREMPIRSRSRFLSPFECVGFSSFFHPAIDRFQKAFALVASMPIVLDSEGASC